MQIAERVHSLAQEQNDSALMIEAYRALAVTLYCSGDPAIRDVTPKFDFWRREPIRSGLKNSAED